MIHVAVDHNWIGRKTRMEIEMLRAYMPDERLYSHQLPLVALT